ncbi:D site-binding protein isoform X2 [Bubalus bubalis]|uniref:D site-binding protein isoform X2 n=1 Tax=Bubalus bubalis TaxID=89462 RepID=UPI001D10429C|nr:D site-binding protein isoform X2 [Bubalus bubalis]
MASRDEECAPGIEPLPAPLKSVEAGRRGCCALGVGGRGGGCRLQRNYRVVIFFSHLPNPPPTSELPLPFLGLCPRPSLHPCPRLFLSLPRSPGPPSPSLFLLSGSLFLSEPLSPPLSGSLLSFSHLLSVSPLSGSLRCGDLPPCSSRFSPLGVDSSSRSSSSSPPCSLFPWPAGLLKEKERKAPPPAATVPGPGLETAGPADASAGAVVGGPSPAPSPVRTPAPSPGPGSCGSASPRSSPGHAPARAALGAAGGHRAGLTSRDTPSPVDPDTVEVLMTFEPDPADLALSSIPGHETFDPRRHRFSEEELKPQPIMKKARKIQVPEEQKDEKYWSRRYKNNEAAKRSRDARRLKENQISVRAAFLEKENALLRQEVVAVRQELSHYRAVLSRYQAQHGAL